MKYLYLSALTILSIILSNCQRDVEDKHLEVWEEVCRVNLEGDSSYLPKSQIYQIKIWTEVRKNAGNIVEVFKGGEMVFSSKFYYNPGEIGCLNNSTELFTDLLVSFYYQKNGQFRNFASELFRDDQRYNCSPYLVMRKLN